MLSFIKVKCCAKTTQKSSITMRRLIVSRGGLRSTVSCGLTKWKSFQKYRKIKQSIPSLSTATDRLLKFFHFSLIVAVDLDFSPFSFFLHTVRIGPYWEYRGEINLHIKSNISQLSQLISTTGRLCSIMGASGRSAHRPSAVVACLGPRSEII